MIEFSNIKTHWRGQWCKKRGVHVHNVVIQARSYAEARKHVLPLHFDPHKREREREREVGDDNRAYIEI
jgi:hypothetical protein